MTDKNQQPDDELVEKTTHMLKKLYVRALPGERLCPNTGEPYSVEEKTGGIAECSECAIEMYPTDIAMNGSRSYDHSHTEETGYKHAR